MNKQCLDVQQMQHLQELGLDTSNASMYWISYNGISAYVPSNFHLPTSDNDYVICDAYTLQDMLSILPTEIRANRRFWLRIDFSDECIYYYCDDFNLVEHREKVFGYDGIDGLIDAAYEMLCWCIEKGYVKTNKEGKQ